MTISRSETSFRSTIVYQRVDQLKPNPNNPREHSPRHVAQIAASIRAYGFSQPILVDSNNVVIAGHGRLAAAILLGLEFVPTICLSHLTKAQVLAYGIADNRLTDLSSFEKKRLAAEFKLILEYDADFDFGTIGFDASSADLIFDLGRAPVNGAKIEAIPQPAEVAVTQLGDLWRLGRHQLLCADARTWASYQTLMQRKRAQLIIADVPYNLKIDGFVSGNGKHKHREFVAAAGELSEAEFIEFLSQAMVNQARASVDGSLHMIFIDWRHMYEVMTAGRAAYDAQANLCVWTKSNASFGSPWRSQHELIVIYKHGTRPHVNNIQLGKHGRNRSNVWAYAGMNSFSRERDEQLSWHSTVKPLDMITDAILDVSRPGDIVLDPFAGSGTTLMAAEKTDREARVMELDPLYCDVIIRRFEKVTGIAAVNAQGITFSECSDTRLGEVE